MIRKLFFGLALAAGAGLTVGCEQAKDAGKDAKKAATDAGKTVGDKAKEGMDKAKDVVKDGADKAKEGLDKAGDAIKAEMEKAKTGFLKPMEDLYPKIEEKIKGLTGDTGTKASAAFAAVKKLIEDFKAAPADKYKELMGGLTSKFDELKKMVGL
jgi:hypothetical protein